MAHVGKSSARAATNPSYL